MRPLAAPRRQWPRAEPEQDTRQPRSSTISEGSAGSCSPRDLPRSATALKMLVGTGGSCPAGPTLAAPREVEPPGQATVPLLCRPNHAASPSLPAQQQKESGGESRKVFFESHFTVPSVGLTPGTPIYPMPPCCLEHFSFGRRKEGGQFSNISGVQR